MEKLNYHEDELNKLFDEVVCTSIVKIIEKVNYSLNHPTWFDRFLIKTLDIIESFVNVFFINILRLLKEEIDRQ